MTRQIQVLDQSAPVIKLIGGQTVIVAQGKPYIDQGVFAVDDNDGDVSGNIVIAGVVDTATVGEYSLSYSVSDSSGNIADIVTRTIKVTDQTPPVIQLNGEPSITIGQSSSYTDLGASASDNNEGNISERLVISGAVDPEHVGVYSITYSVSDSVGNQALPASRTVTVVDLIAPEITITGSVSVDVAQGTQYVELGATAVDNSDDDLSANIVTTGSVDTALTGTYIISYSVTDSAGNTAAQASRFVTVSDQTAPVLTLKGESSITVGQNSVYIDAGVIATDNNDGLITASVIRTGEVDTISLGTYQLFYNVADAAGNSAVQLGRTVIVTDQAAPVITLNGAADITVAHGSTYVDAGATAVDMVDGDLSAQVVTMGAVDTNSLDSYTVNYDVSDTAGNTAIRVVRTVIVTDQTAPVISLNGEATITVAHGSMYADTGATALDVVDGDLSAKILVNSSVDTTQVGTYAVSYTVSDTAGNTALEVTRTVVVSDQAAPVITLNGETNLTVALGATYADAGSTAVDAVDGDISASVVATGLVDTSQLGSYTLLFDVSDAAGNAATQVIRTVVVTDQTAPVITLQGEASVTVAHGTTYIDAGATASDTIDGEISAAIVVTGSVDTTQVGSYALNYNVSDTAGNAAIQVIRTVVVTDQTAPIITLQGEASVTVAHGAIYTDAGATASDTVDGNISAAIVVTGLVDTAQVGSYTLNYDVSDTAGNAAAQLTRTVIVADQAAPVISLHGEVTVIVAHGATYSDAGATAVDAVDGNVSAQIVVDSTVDTNAVGLYVVSYTVSDIAGNAAIPVTRTVMVTDQAAPVLELNGATSVRVSLGDDYTDTGAIATDSVDGDLTSQIVVTGAVDTLTPGLYELLFNVADTAGNQAQSVVRSVEVIDDIAPQVTAPQSIVVAAGNASGTPALDSRIALFLASATALDNVDGIIGSIQHDAPEVFPVNIETIVSFSATDSAGNVGIAQASVTVEDQTAPVLTLVGQTSVTIDVAQDYEDAGAMAMDNVDGDISGRVVVLGLEDVNTSVLGSYVIAYNVSDAAGNAATSITRTVVVQDSFAPVVTAPNSIVVPAVDSRGVAIDSAVIQVYMSSASAQDNVDGAVDISSHNAPVDYFPLGVTTVLFSAIDTTGNIGTAQSTVTVADMTAPVMTLNGAASITLAVGDAYEELGATAMDNVDGSIPAEEVEVSGVVDTQRVGIYILTYNVTDQAGNATDPQTRQVSVQDVVAPVVTVPLSIEVPAVDANGVGSDHTDIAGFLIQATASDDIDGDIVPENDAPLVFPLGVTTVTFKAVDSAGNIGFASAMVSVVDQTAPDLVLLGEANMTFNVGEEYIELGAQATDNVDGDLTANILVSGDIDTTQLGNYVVVYTVTDQAGNATEKSRMISVVSTSSAPVVIAPESITVSAVDQDGVSSNRWKIQVFLNSAFAYDSDEWLFYDVEHDAPEVLPLGTTTVTFSATNIYGAVGQAQATVTVIDTTKPKITLVGDRVIKLRVGDTYEEQGALAFDNVDGNITSSIRIRNNVDTSRAGRYKVRYIVFDAAGNKKVVRRTVKVRKAKKNAGTDNNLTFDEWLNQFLASLFNW